MGDHRVWEGLLGPDRKLHTLDQAFAARYQECIRQGIPARRFPYWTTVKIVLANPRVIVPGIRLGMCVYMYCIYYTYVIVCIKAYLGGFNTKLTLLYVIICLFL